MKRKGFVTLLRRTLLAIAVLIVSLVAIGAVYQTILSKKDLAELRPPGTLIDMGGYRLHLHCTGAAKPSDITALLESGLSSTTSSWERIQEHLQQHVRVCSYDRGGIGWSDATLAPRDGDGIAKELKELLSRSGVSGRLVMVGHSSGGLYVRSFQAKYPEQVAGMVLLDASHENQFDGPESTQSPLKKIRSAYGMLPAAARVGLVRIGPLCRLPADFPTAAGQNFHARCSLPASWRAGRAEVDALRQTMVALRSSTLGNLPLVVVTAGNDPQNPANWPDLQSRLAALSTASSHVTLKDATHPDLILDATFAQTCAEEILKVVERVRE